MIFCGFLSRLWIGLALLCALATPAFAHAQLLGTDPVDNAVLEAAPAALNLRFNEPVTPLAMTLINPTGVRADLTTATRAGDTMTVPLDTPLGTGTHVLSWRVTSIDGHPIGGALIFSIGRATDAAMVPQGDEATSIALWLSKLALFIALFFGLGGVFFRIVAPLPHGFERVAKGLSGAGLVLAPLSLGLHGLDALGLPLSGFGDVAAWNAALATSYGATAIMLTLAFALGAIALRVPAGWRATGVGLIAVLLGALSLSLSGHAGAAAPQWLTRPAVFLHVGGILFWAGALMPLAVYLRTPSPENGRALARFSRVIPVAVAPLLVSGATLGVIQMGAPGPTWLSPYGWIFGAKLFLVLGLFALALWNRFGLTRPALAGDGAAQRHLRRSVIVETLLVVLVLGLAAGWRFTPPPRALVEVPPAEPILVHAMNTNVMANVVITGAPGTAGVEIALTDINYGAIKAQSVTAFVSSEALGVAPIRRKAEPMPTGWRIDNLAIPLPGTWTLTLEIRLGRFDLAKIAANFDVP